MRSRQDNQGVLEFQRPTLLLTVEHYSRYERIDEILRSERGLLDLVHKDLEKPLERENKDRDRRCQYTSDNVLRILICKTIEGETFRGITVRIDDSDFFRKFTRINDKDMMTYSTLNWLANKIAPETWKRVNDRLARHAVAKEWIDGEKLRVDTTAVETNIHWPTDSSLLWDVYRVLARCIAAVREQEPLVVGDARLQTERVKKIYTKICREARKKRWSSPRLKRLYKALLGRVGALLALSERVADRLELKAQRNHIDTSLHVPAFVRQLRHYAELGDRVVDQARRRVLFGEQVPNDQKLFSIFETHTELLKRGKAGKPVEFGHMVMFQQVACKFITAYRVFDEKPIEHELVDDAVKSHSRLFGARPTVLSADKGFYESMAKIAQLELDIDTVAIAKKGSRTEAETERETSIMFKVAQRFRAGIEGTISFLKRCLRLFRCFNKGFAHYEATIGLTVFAHNLLVLCRDTS